MKNILLILLIFLISTLAYSQESQRSNNYIYKVLTPKEKKTSIDTLEILQFGTIPNYVHDYDLLPSGLFLVVDTSWNQIHKRIIEIPPFKAEIIDNFFGFSIYVYDNKYVPISNATVDFDSISLPYDSISKTYYKKNLHKYNGTITITYNGYISKYDITSKKTKLASSYNSSNDKFRFKHFLFYHTPIKIIYLPIYQLCRLPQRIQLKKENDNIKLYEPYNINWIKEKLKIHYYNLHPLKSDTACLNQVPLHYAYKAEIILNKKNYNENDTLKAKIKISNKVKNVKVLIVSYKYGLSNSRIFYSKKIRITKHNNEIKIPLKGLKQNSKDVNYSIVVKPIGSLKINSETSFKIDAPIEESNFDYWKINYPKNKFFANDTIRYSIFGFQAIKNTADSFSVQITVDRTNILQYLGQYEFIQKNKIEKKYTFTANGTCDIQLYASDFSNIDGEYKSTISIIKNNKTIKTESHIFSIIKSPPNDILITPLDSCLKIEYISNNKSISTQGIIIYTYKSSYYKENRKIDTITLPANIPYNPTANSITVCSQNIFATHDYTFKNIIFPYAYFSHKKLQVNIINKAKTPIWYSIVEDKKPKIYVTGNTLNILNYKKKQTLSIQYTDENNKQNLNYYYLNKNLAPFNITLSHPEVINKNDTAIITVRVTNTKGKPLKNIELTCNTLDFEANQYYHTYQTKKHDVIFPQKGNEFKMERYSNQEYYKSQTTKMNQINNFDSLFSPPPYSKDNFYYYKSPINIELVIRYLPKYNDKQIFRILVTNIKDSVTVINKGILGKNIHNNISLFPSKIGSYFITLVDVDNNCWMSDTFSIKPNGITFYRIPDTIQFNKKFSQHPLSKFVKEYDKPVRITQKFITSNKTQIKELSNGTYIISGYVFNNKGKPVKNVIVNEKGNITKDTSNEKGYWEIITKNPKAVLQFSSIGYSPIEYSYSENSIVMFKECLLSIDSLYKTNYINELKRMDFYDSPSDDIMGDYFEVSGYYKLIVPQKIGISTNDKFLDRILYIIDGNIKGFSDSCLFNVDSIISIQYFDVDYKYLYGFPRLSRFCIVTTSKLGLPKIEPSISYSISSENNLFSMPTLRTDKNGEATFKTVLPNQKNIWDIHVFAKGKNSKSGFAQSIIITE